MSNSANIIRIQCDLASQYRSFVNVADGGPVKMARSRAHRFEIGLYDKGIFQGDMSQFSSITLEVKAQSARTGANLISKTLTAASFVAIAEGQWVNRTSQHAAIDLSSSDCALTVDSTNVLALWIVITGTTAVGGNTVTLAAGNATMTEDGGQYSGVTPTPTTPNYLNADQTIAAIASHGSTPVNGIRIIDSVSGVTQILRIADKQIVVDEA